MEEKFGTASALEGQLQVKCPHGSFNLPWCFLHEWTISWTRRPHFSCSPISWEDYHLWSRQPQDVKPPVIPRTATKIGRLLPRTDTIAFPICCISKLNQKSIYPSTKEACRRHGKNLIMKREVNFKILCSWLRGKNIDKTIKVTADQSRMKR